MERSDNKLVRISDVIFIVEIHHDLIPALQARCNQLTKPFIIAVIQFTLNTYG